jgi:uncharacterized OB-fold protein/acyl dehydratase
MTLSKQQKQELETRLRAYVGREDGPPQTGRDPVNEPMIRQWCEAMGDANPIYTDPDAARRSAHGGIVAPPTMLQAWILPGLEMARPGKPRIKQQELHQLLSEYGYTSVVATDCKQEYRRYLRPGDRVSATTVIESISEEKATALGIGYFIDTRTVFQDQNGDELGWMTFRVLKFRPAEQPAPVEGKATPAKPTRLRPPKGHDNAWWWEAVDRGELRIQKCGTCGELRHPPRPMCGKCRSVAWDSVVSKGRGTVHSYVVVHHPQVPGYELPLIVALVDLEEGTRLVANVAGCELDDVYIGMPLEAHIESADEGLKLPFFRPVR